MKNLMGSLFIQALFFVTLNSRFISLIFEVLSEFLIEFLCAAKMVEKRMILEIMPIVCLSMES